MLNAMVGGVLRDLAADGGAGGQIVSGAFAAGETVNVGFKPRFLVVGLNAIGGLIFAGSGAGSDILLGNGVNFASVVTFTDTGFSVAANSAGRYFAFE